MPNLGPPAKPDTRKKTDDHPDARHKRGANCDEHHLAHPLSPRNDTQDDEQGEQYRYGSPDAKAPVVDCVRDFEAAIDQGGARLHVLGEKQRSCLTLELRDHINSEAID